MKLYLVNPLFERSIWSFPGLRAFTGARFFSTPLGLATIAALTPPHWDIEIADENVESIDFDSDADLIGMGPFNVQYQRSLEIAREFRRRGKPVVFGGPYCSLDPQAFAGHGDYRICGEAESIWPQFVRDFERGLARECYTASAQKARLTDSPVPRYDLIRGSLYTVFQIQASRGCPFECEFCDIIVVDGRVPRVKTVEQVVLEVDECVRRRAHHVNFADANFIANIPYAKRLLKALAEYSLAHDYPVEFSCELTINVAHDETLLELLHAANFTSLFVGIESPRRESLLETKKGQNTRRSMVDDVKRIQAHDISVMAGMIVGFDSDDQRIFREQYSFLQDLGTPFTTCGTLVALPNTPLMKRLQSEGRMLDLDMERVNGHGAADCNFVPRQMTRQELFDGYSWLQRSLYRYDSFSERLVTLLSRYQTRRAHKRASPNGLLMRALVKVLAYYLLTLDRQRFWFFTSTAWKVAAAGRFSVGKWLEFFRWMAFYPSLRAFVVDLQGMPEMANPARPPFEGVAQIPTAAARAS